MKKLFMILIIVYQIPGSIQAFGPIFTFFIRQFPEAVLLPDPEKLTTAAEKASLSRKIIENICPRTNEGIIATYAGFTTISNFNGQITFPRMHQAPQFTLIITPSIKPIFMLGNTIHHWELIPSLPYEAYSIIRHEDPASNAFYWEVTKLATIPDNIIPFQDAITLFGTPKNFLVPEGITITRNSVNFLLPQLYIRKNRTGFLAALNFLKYRAFFDPIKRAQQKVNDTTFASTIIGH